MTVSKAALVLAPALLLAACERDQPAPGSAREAAAPSPAATPAPWFICDALNEPAVLIFSEPDSAGETTVLSLDKADDHPPVARRYGVGAPTPRDGAQMRALTEDGEAIGEVQTLDPARLAQPQGAATPPVVEVRLDGATYSCRWLLRTRLFGVAAGRTVLITDEAEGPMLRTFDFTAPKGGRVLPDGAQRSSQPTVRLQAGKREGDRWVFANEGYGYAVGPAGLSITDDGRATTEEPFIAVQRGRD